MAHESVDVTKNMTDEAKKTPKDTSQIKQTEPRLVRRSGFDGPLSGKLLPVYTESSMAIDDVSHPRVLNCR